MSSSPMHLEDLPDILTIPELAELFRMSRSTGYDYARRGLLPVPVIRCGRRVYVSKEAVVRILRECLPETANES